MAELVGALSTESSFAGASTEPTDRMDSCSVGASAASESALTSSSPTPPTSVSDIVSFSSGPSKTEIEDVIALLQQPAVAAVIPLSDATAAELKVQVQAQVEVQVEVRLQAEAEALGSQRADTAARTMASTPPSNKTSSLPVPRPQTATGAARPAPAATTPSRSRRPRHSEPVYNLAKLSGTACHGKRAANGDIISNRRRKTSSAATAAATATPAGPVTTSYFAPQDGAVVPSVEQAGKAERQSPGIENNIIVAKSAPSPVHVSIDAVGLMDVDQTAVAPSGQNDKQIKPQRPARAPRAQSTPAAAGAQRTNATNANPVSRSRPDPPTISRPATRLSGSIGESLATKANRLVSISKRSRKSLAQQQSEMAKPPRELKRLQDTNEFSGVEVKPVIYTVWRNGKYVDETAEEVAVKEAEQKKKTPTETPHLEPKVEKAVVEADKAAAEPAKAEAEREKSPVKKRKRVKRWLDKGLYAGQTLPEDPFASLTLCERKQLARIPELSEAVKPNKALPFPIFNGLRLLLKGRDFRLPFDVCHPLKDQPKPSEWRKITKSRFVGDAAAHWRKDTYYDRATCVCTPEDGCGDHCLNRSVLYECNEVNCNIGREFCRNRSFQDLQERSKKGGAYRIGVEVVQTGERGFGVRANRCFEPNQIIMEYAGEIITEEECDRRMNEVYKDKDCYYLMSFDQNMILDATTGSIARFVNHSCSPNCRMIKWIVSGAPRMALFAGDNPIVTGEELTYDYNFDPFSAKNVQKCLCGSENCRGFLGPKNNKNNSNGNTSGIGTGTGSNSSSNSNSNSSNTSNNAGNAKNSPKKGAVAAVAAFKATVKAGKRKLMELFEGEEGKSQENANPNAKKRKVMAAVGPKRSASSASIQAAKGATQTAAKTAASVIKRTQSTITVNANRVSKATSRITSHMTMSTSNLSTSSLRGASKVLNRRASTSTLLKKKGSNRGSSTKAAATTAATLTRVSPRKSTPSKKAESATVTLLGSPLDSEEEAPKLTPRAKRTEGAASPSSSRESALSTGRSRKPSAKAKEAMEATATAAPMKLELPTWREPSPIPAPARPFEAAGVWRRKGGRRSSASVGKTTLGRTAVSKPRKLGWAAARKMTAKGGNLVGSRKSGRFRSPTATATATATAISTPSSTYSVPTSPATPPSRRADGGGGGQEDVYAVAQSPVLERRRALEINRASSRIRLVTGDD